MAEIWFYHLTRAPLEKALPTLVERSRARGWNVVIRTGSVERLAALDDLLWTYSEESFLAHGTDSEEDPASQPVLLTTKDGLENGAQVLFLVDNAPLPQVWPSERVVMMFDGHDPEATDAARAAWREVRNLGHAVQYWQQDEAGSWVKKA